MPKKQKGGGGAHRKTRAAETTNQRPLRFADVDPTQDILEGYGLVVAALGQRRFSVRDALNRVRVGHLCGAMRRGERVARDAVVLFSVRSFQPDKIDVIHVYSGNEVRNLQAYGELPPGFCTDTEATTEDDIVFDDTSVWDDEAIAMI